MRLAPARLVGDFIAMGREEGRGRGPGGRGDSALIKTEIAAPARAGGRRVPSCLVARSAVPGPPPHPASPLPPGPAGPGAVFISQLPTVDSGGDRYPGAQSLTRPPFLTPPTSPRPASGGDETERHLPAPADQHVPARYQGPAGGWRHRDPGLEVWSGAWERDCWGPREGARSGDSDCWKDGKV